MSGVAEQARTVDDAARDDRPGIVSRFVERVDALPAHGWWVYPGILVAVLGWGYAILWVTGSVPLGAFDRSLAASALYGPFMLLAIAAGRHVAARALDDFWPATGWPDRDRAAWQDRFAHPPGSWEAAALVIGGIAGLASLLAAPVLVLAAEDGRLTVAIAHLPGYVLGYAFSAVGFAFLVRWTWLVTRIHSEATAVDPFDPGPIHAFSRLTGANGLTTLIVVYYSFSVNASAQAGNVPSLAFLATSMALGMAAFVVPLWGMHQRLVRAKSAMLRDVERRTTAVSGDLYARIDAGDLAATETVEHALASLAAVRARAVALPTWPWSPQLFRGFVSALVLPVVLFILTRVAEVVFEL